MVRSGGIRFSRGGRLEAPALCPEQHNRRLVGHKLLVYEYSIKGLVGHPLEMAARSNLFSWFEQLHKKRATLDSLLVTCRGLISLRNS